jgi:hypothetical protein
MNTERRDVFWKKFPGLAWSNTKAGDSVMIRAALSRPRFHQLLSICLEFGMRRVEHEFEMIRDEFPSPAAVSMVSGMLDNINKGFQRAEEGNGRRLAEAARTA